jgi:hypothetical protein
VQTVRGRRIDRSVPLFATLIFIPDFQARIGGVFVDGVDRYLKFDDRYYPYLPEVAPAVRRAEVAIESRFVKRADKLMSIWSASAS